VQQAGFWLRFAAYLIDGLILFVAQLAVFIVFGLLGGAIDAALPGARPTSGVGVGGSTTSLIAYAVVIVGSWLYFSLQESSVQQATLGKRALGIKVTDLEGRRVSFGRATGRYFAKILSVLICYVGFIMAGFTDRKQALHDMIAGTLVVRTHPVSGQLQAAGSGSAASAVFVSVAAAILVLVLTSIVVIVILLTMGGQIKNVFSNVVVALNS
jgi:uncharacterized RDD family membrane protein YckC